MKNPGIKENLWLRHPLKEIFNPRKVFSHVYAEKK
jgi:hypothetical protein